MVDIIALKLVAYGNTGKNSDGSFTCQHGADECVTDSLDLCTQYKLGTIKSIDSGDTSITAWPFILCMEEAEGKSSYGEGCFTSTMTNTTDLQWSDILDCASNEYDLVMNAAKDATPTHSYVPWMLVGGELLDNTNLLQQAVCDAYTGTPPESCKSLKSEVAPDTIKPCYNKER